MWHLVRLSSVLFFAIGLLLVSINTYGQCSAEAGSNQTVCAGSSISLGGSPSAFGGVAPYSYSWSGLSGIAATANPSTVLFTTTTLTLTITDATGCVATDDVTITVLPQPMAFGGNDRELCLNSPSVNLGGSGTWSGSASVTASGIFTPSSVGDHNLILTVSSGNCTLTDAVLIKVLALPTANAGVDQNLCAGQSTTLTASGTSPNGAITLYTWSGGAVSNSLSPTPNVTPVNNTTYNVTVVDVKGCSDPDQVTVFVNAIPVVDAGADITMCNQPVVAQMGNYTPIGGTWSGNGVLSNGNFTPTGVGDYTLTYSVPGTNGCVGTDSRVVHVVPSMSVDAGSDVVVCANAGAVSLQPITSGGFWSGNAQVSFSGVFTPTQIGSFNISYTVNGGNCTVTDNVTVTVINAPSVIVNSPMQACAGSAFNASMQASGGTGVYSTYVWLDNSSGQVIGSGPNASFTFNTDKQLTIRVIDNAGCVGSSTVSFDAIDLPNVSAGMDATFCNQALPNALTGFSPAGGVWSGQGVTSSGLFTPTSVGTFPLTYCYTNSSGCTSCDELIVSVIYPTPVFAGNDQTVCMNAQIFNLSAFTSNNGTWSGNGVVNSTLGSFNPSIAGVGTHTVILTSGAGNCQSTDEVQITVLELPAIDAGVGSYVCRNSNEFTMDGGVPSGGIWSGNGITAGYSEGELNYYFDSTLPAGSYTATYSITDPANGCVNSDSRIVQVVSNPIASFSTTSYSCQDADVALVNSSVGATQYRWDFNGEGVSNVANPQFYFYDEGPKNIELRVLNDYGCADSILQSTVVVEAPHAAMGLSQTEGCSPLAIDFTNNSEGDNVTYQWSLVNLNTMVETPGQLTYTASNITTEYMVSLSVSNVCGTDVDLETITVMPKPVANIATSLLSTSCTPVLADIEDNSFGEVDHWSWNLGNGFVTDSQNPGVQSFTTGNNATSYPIRLIVSNACGVDTLIQPFLVQPNVVHASFNVNAVEGCTPFQLNCVNASQNGTSVYYDFAGLDASDDQNANFTFNSPGSYSVRLVATDGCGTDEVIKVIQVNQTPEVEFTMSSNTVCELSEVTFQTTATESHLQWNVGDGATGFGNEFTHSYTEANNYTVALEVTSDNGCSNEATRVLSVNEKPVANFSFENSTSCSPVQACLQNQTTGADTYHWSFGLGEGSSMEISPCHSYVNNTNEPVYYTIELHASNQYGCADSKISQIEIKPSPSAYFELDSYSSCVAPVVLHTVSTPPVSESYSWRVNGEEVSNNQITPIQINNVGDYEIEFYTTNQFGCSDSSSRVYSLFEPVVAGIASSVANGCLPLEVQFTNTSSNSAHMQWNFDDGDSSTEMNPLHVFDEQGVFDIHVIAISADGCMDTLEVGNMIETYETPNASFVFTPEETSIYFPEVQFINTCEDAVSVSWNFGDGAIADGNSAVHTYGHAGNWNATQTVTNIFGCTDSRTEQVNITNEFFVYVPNAFSPDGDGTNDVFKPEIAGLEFVEKYDFRIFNRWGGEVFSTNDPKMAWVGNHQGGDVYVENQSYSYRITIKFFDNTAEKVLEGAITMLR